MVPRRKRDMQSDNTPRRRRTAKSWSASGSPDIRRRHAGKPEEAQPDARPLEPEKERNESFKPSKPVPREKLHTRFIQFFKRFFAKKTMARLAMLLVIFAMVVVEFIRLCDMSYFVDTFYEVDEEKIKSHVRIVLLTDLHLHEFGEDNIELVDEIKRLKPDLIAMAGDMVDMNKTDYSVVLTLCRQLVEVAPVYFSYGNHEKEVIRVKQTSTINVDLEEMGVVVLHNRYKTIEVNGNLIDIGGLSANPGTFEADYTQSFWESYMKSENYRLLLVHYPQFFYEGGELFGLPIDLALCGHLHGGQVVIPFIGGLYHPLQGLFPELADGCHHIGDTYVVVSRGLGNGKALPRVNNPPELVIVDLY